LRRFNTAGISFLPRAAYYRIHPDIRYHRPVDGSCISAVEEYYSKITDRVFYPTNYQSRQELLGFSSRMGHILNLQELADEMLLPL